MADPVNRSANNVEDEDDSDYSDNELWDSDGEDEDSDYVYGEPNFEMEVDQENEQQENPDEINADDGNNSEDNDDDDDNDENDLEDEGEEGWRLPDGSGEPPGRMRNLEQIFDLRESADAASRSGDMPQDFLDGVDVENLVYRKNFPSKKHKRVKKRLVKKHSKCSCRSDAANRFRSRSPHHKRSTNSTS